ncbi:hypothetical protein EVAR_11424_1 [Eumeta japonica]|uniref:Uncharacterized protein n=1 Tax=Eumeta variegata TaxID=151549 RepID=A0A4C1TKU1_EUMVA|nr:hypothetical protein EVAR_11424_1 [Eumeta japonica]
MEQLEDELVPMVAVPDDLTVQLNEDEVRDLAEELNSVNAKVNSTDSVTRTPTSDKQPDKCVLVGSNVCRERCLQTVAGRRADGARRSRRPPPAGSRAAPALPHAAYLPPYRYFPLFFFHFGMLSQKSDLMTMEREQRLRMRRQSSLPEYSKANKTRQRFEQAYFNDWSGDGYSKSPSVFDTTLTQSRRSLLNNIMAYIRSPTVRPSPSLNI